MEKTKGRCPIARVLIPDTAEFLKNYAGSAYGKTIAKAPDYLGKVAGLVQYADKLAESPGLTYVIDAIRRKAGETEAGLNEAIAAKKRTEAAQPRGIGGSTAGQGPVEGGAELSMEGLSEEERRALAAMTPQQQMMYIAAKKRVAVSAEQVDFLKAQERVKALGQDYMEQKLGFERQTQSGLPDEVWEKFSDAEKKAYMEQKLKNDKDRYLQRGLEKEPAPASVPTPSATAFPVSAVPAGGAPVAAGGATARVGATTVVPPSAPVYPEAGVGQGPASFAGTPDLWERIQAEKDPKKREALLRMLADQAIGIAGASGTAAAPATAATPVPGMERTQIRGELGERAKLGLEDREMTPENLDLMKKYGMDPDAIRRYQAMKGLDISPPPGGQAFQQLKTTENIMSAARMADTPEKQKIVLQAVQNLQFPPKNVYEAFGFGAPDPERRMKFGIEVASLFPKKTAQDTYYDLLLKQEQARAKAEGSATQAAMRPATVAKAEAGVRREDAAVMEAQARARSLEAKTRTEDFLRQEKLSKELVGMTADLIRADAAMRAARRPAGGGAQFWLKEKMTLDAMKDLRDQMADGLKQAADSDKAAAEADARATYTPPANKADIEKEAKYVPPGRVKRSEKVAVDAKVKAAKDAKKQLDEINKAEATARGAKAEADKHRADAKAARDRAADAKKRYDDMTEKAKIAPPKSETPNP